MQTPASGWLFESSYHALLLGGLCLAVFLAWLAWRRQPSADARYVWLGALSILATMVLRVPFSALADARGMADAVWIGPFDRLLGVTMLVMLGWTLTTGPRSWRLFLGAGFAATAITYLTWAPSWAAEFTLRPEMATDPAAMHPVMGLARIWDAWQILLAFSVGTALVRTSPRVPRWLLAAVAALAVGSLFELFDPVAAFPAWSRLGTLAAGGFFVAAAVSQLLELRADGEAAVSAGPAVLPAAPELAEDTPDLSPDAAATQVLFETMGRLGAAPALFCIISETGQLTAWGVARSGEGSRRLGELPLSSHPTITRALGSTGLRLRTSRIAKDVTQLYGLMGVSTDGPVMLQPVTATGLRGVIVAGRARDRWRESEQAALAVVARRAARLLERLATPEPEAQIEHVYDVLETQTESVTRLAQIVEGLSERLVQLESGGAEVATNTAVGMAYDVGAREDFDARVLQYEMAIEALPWGVMVTDASGGLVFANRATARLLHIDTLYPGQPATEIFPDADRMAFALERCSDLAGEDTPSLEIVFESPSLRVELEPLTDANLGYLGSVAVIRTRAPETGPVETEVMMALAEALKSPMTSILGYSDLLSRGVGLSQDQLDRYLQRIDANLARMQVNLENLVTVLDVNADKLALNPGGVDINRELEEAQQRCRPQLDEKALVVDYEPNPSLPAASADRKALEQILDNLLVNAAQRSPQGGDIALAAELRGDTSGGEAIVVTVADRGPGTSANGRSSVGLDELEGAGVNLTVVRLLAERLGGKAWAESEAGRTRFLVRLPVRRRPAAPVAPALPAAPADDGAIPGAADSEAEFDGASGAGPDESADAQAGSGPD